MTLYTRLPVERFIICQVDLYAVIREARPYMPLGTLTDLVSDAAGVDRIEAVDIIHRATNGVYIDPDIILSDAPDFDPDARHPDYE